MAVFRKDKAAGKRTTQRKIEEKKFNIEKENKILKKKSNRNWLIVNRWLVALV